ncbi:MAG: hypothetical protein CMM17_07290 [Rhodospirillaceae bacterium]|jgi:hypothetical protein|nr:hypothetical protein [Rhodospirillaceae bacterium]|tara:strand:- start:5031 stop:5249 length:219 start_codon:yes stop_codon:yes gene_type:complete
MTDDLVKETSPEVVDETVRAFLDARKNGASRLSAYMIARAVYRQHCPDDPINRPIIFAMVAAAESIEEKPDN